MLKFKRRRLVLLVFTSQTHKYISDLQIEFTKQVPLSALFEPSVSTPVTKGVQSPVYPIIAPPSHLHHCSVALLSMTPTSQERLALEAQQAADLRHFDAEWSQFREHLSDQHTRAIASLHAMHAMASANAAHLEAAARGELLYAYEQQRTAARRSTPPPPASGEDPHKVKRTLDDTS
ncbi:Aste57867_16719 [Aphanomyces stellatus]|uniref:Aste57867_16719 protein n=1 Tax=Aphanomyces stellatus TaxID=120398 RepID=A0A485L647_9STRA|nr:hypothetical protein As57867_016662 [Aphanomyces stellatus]VFT93489.1 Aste57867_16719 [Aphanomyces stellatus]